MSALMLIVGNDAAVGSDDAVADAFKVVADTVPLWLSHSCRQCLLLLSTGLLLLA